MNKTFSTKNILIIITLSLSTIAIMGDMVIIPVAENLYTEFFDTSIGILNFILSGPALIGAFASLLCGKLMYYMSKKLLLIISFAIFSVGAICGNLVHSAMYMAAMRALVGVGVGGVGVLAMAIISDLFVDEKQRSSVMGIYNGLMAAVGALLGWVSGMVAMIGWTLVFRVYLAAIPIFAMILIFIPADKAAAAAQDEESGEKEKMPWTKLISMNGAFFVYNIIYCIIYYQVAMVIVEKGIGDVSLIGISSALGTVGSFVACTAFGLYYSKLKRFTPVVGFAAMAGSYMLLYSATSPAMALVACTLLGGLYGGGMSFYFMNCTVIVPPTQIPMSISVTTFGMSVSTFLSTYAATALQSILGVSTLTEIIPTLAVILGVGAVLSLILAVRSRNAAKNEVV